MTKNSKENRMRNIMRSSWSFSKGAKSAEKDPIWQLSSLLARLRFLPPYLLWSTIHFVQIWWLGPLLGQCLLQVEDFQSKRSLHGRSDPFEFVGWTSLPPPYLLALLNHTSRPEMMIETTFQSEISSLSSSSLPQNAAEKVSRRNWYWNLQKKAATKDFCIKC